MAYSISATTKGGRNGRAILDNGGLALAMGLQKEFGGNGEQRVMGNYGAAAEQYGFLLETVQHQAEGFHDIDRSGSDTGFEIEDYVAKARLNSAEGARFHQQLDVKLQYSDETSTTKDSRSAVRIGGSSPTCSGQVAMKVTA